MDYSTLRNIKAELKTPQEHVADGIDLSNNYANDNDQRKFYSKYLNNHKINNNCASDCDEDQKNVTDLAKQTKIKLNFSVDRILGNSHVDHCSDGCSNDKAVVDRNGMFADKFNQNCLDCSTVPNIPSAVNSPYFSVPFSMAALLNLNKSIVRPMPVRYMTRSPTVHSTSNIPSQSPFVKFHQHNTNSSHQQCTYSNGKPQTNPNSLQRPHISMADNQTMQTNSGNSKRKRSWSRAVFSQLQRKGLEIQFQIQKYITKPDRRKLAARLGLTDAQVKVWFQNRRMKWRHTREAKLNQDKSANGSKKCEDQLNDNETSSSSDEDEIDVVAE
ncbi:homeobox protein H2.0-like [Bradysia coprophila]|uniref:homeobox protein H2.0-like n=1 Tax=Bradysia coprophila TaxID=38358 RepID=UPI00187D7213|nr:homeobox protein H2.0-like [Bradysia coprophila]XP_037041171.1 homeobox protein H2.0-like [Bradysia coprophila]XP_037041172.1 homeobox protein H2.0-like [Bradysia coprophila]